MPRLFNSFLLAVAANFLLLPPVMAEETKVTTETLTVHGHPPSAAELDAGVATFVEDQTALSPTISQVTRWLDPPCLRVQNLGADYAKIIVERFKIAARGVGLTVQKDDCKPTVDVYFTGQPQAFLDAIAEKRPMMLGYHYPDKTKEVAQVKRPIQGWYITDTKSQACVRMDDPDYINTHACGAKQLSHLSHGLESVFEYITIVANLSAMKDPQLGAIADYIAMIALSKPQNADHCGDLPSILDLTRNCAESRPSALTVTDKAYLKGLYGTDPRAFGTEQKGLIAAQMKKELGAR